MLLALLSKDNPGFRLAIPALFATLGVTLIAGNVMTLPGWARDRERLMEQFANRATLLVPPAAAD
jgi:hypothetical protein